MSPILKAVSIASCLLHLTGVFAHQIITTDTSFISEAIERKCSDMFSLDGARNLEIFLDLEDCTDSISIALIEGHQEKKLRDKNYLARAIELAYAELVKQDADLVIND